MNNVEIEKKYLVDLKNVPQKNYLCKKITQGYIYNDDITEIRIRKVESEDLTKYYYTVKINNIDMIQRNEIEFEINQEQFQFLLSKILINTHLIKNDRYLIPIENNLIAELDIYYNELDDLATVEVEFPNLDMAINFEAPSWFGIEITNNKSYKNKNLAKKFK